MQYNDDPLYSDHRTGSVLLSVHTKKKKKREISVSPYEITLSNT
jgi:hypothetical protein